MTPSGSRDEDRVHANMITASSIVQILGKENYVINKQGANSYTADHGEWLDKKKNLAQVMRFVEEVGPPHGELSTLAPA